MIPGSVEGWLVSLLGDSLVSVLRRTPDDRLLDTAAQTAVASVLARVEGADRQHVRRALQECFSRPPVVSLDPDVPVADGLRATVAAQIAILRDMVANERGGRPFFETVTVTEDWLAAELAKAFWEAVRSGLASSGVAELVRSWEGEQVRGTLADLLATVARIEARIGTSSRQGAARFLIGVIPQPADCLQPREAATVLAQAPAGGDTALSTGVLTGMGGVGKTQLAAACARRAWTSAEADLVVWATASSRQGIISAYAAAAARLGLVDAEQAVEVAAQRFLEWCQIDAMAWLVVLDDIQNPADLRGLWPVTEGRGRVLATTRHREGALFGQGRQRIFIDEFTRSEARAYLEAKLATHGRSDDPQQVDALSASLYFLPLALAQAAAFIIDQDIDCAQYRTLLAERLLCHAVPEASGLPDNHERIISATWDLSIEQADKARPAGLARPLLQLASILDPNGIPASVLTSEPARQYLATRMPGAPRHVTEVGSGAVNQALRVLHMFSLIDDHRHVQLDAEGVQYDHMVGIHALVQRSVREDLQAADPAEFAELARAAALALHQTWTNLAVPGHWPLLSTKFKIAEYLQSEQLKREAFHHLLTVLDQKSSDEKKALAWDATYVIEENLSYLLPLVIECLGGEAVTESHGASQLGPDACATQEAASSLAYILGTLGDQENVEELIPVLCTALTKWRYRKRFVEALMRCVHIDSLRALQIHAQQELLKSEPDLEVLEVLARALSTLECQLHVRDAATTVSVLREIERIAQTERKPWIARAAAEGIAILEDPSYPIPEICETEIIDRLRSRDWKVIKDYAVHASERLRAGHESADLLRALLQAFAHEDAVAKEAVATALGHCNSPEAREAITTALQQSRAPNVLAACRRALS